MKPATRRDQAVHTNESNYMVELREVKAMVEKLSMQETLDSRSQTQELVIAKLSAQVEELTRRLAKPEDGQVG